MTRDYKVLSIFLIITISLIFLDAYVFFSIPIAWIGQLLLFLLALTKFNIFKDTFNTSIFSTIILLVTVPQIYVTFFTTNPNQDITYTMLRYFNIVSFLVVFAFTINVSSKNKSLNDEILRKLKNFCFIFSLMVIYIFIAQIYDLYEPFRNRSNTNLFGESSQSTFWLSQPHRAMGTFREPSFLITFFYPLV